MVTQRYSLNFPAQSVHRTIIYYYITCNIHAKVCASVCPPGDNKSVITDSLSSASPSMWSYPQLSSRFFMFNEVPLGILPSLLDDSPRRLSSRQSRIHFGKFIYYFWSFIASSFHKILRIWIISTIGCSV